MSIGLPVYPPPLPFPASPNESAADSTTLDVLQLTGRDHLSHSQVRTYQACPLKWHFQYVREEPPEFTPSAMQFGIGVHAAIEQYFQALMADEAPPTPPQLLEFFQQAWECDAVAPVRLGSGETVDRLREQACDLLTSFLQSPVAQPTDEILAIEEPLRGTLAPDIPDILARLDLVLLTKDALVVRDFKTSRTRWNADRLEESATQMRLYEHLSQSLAHACERRTIRLEFVVLTRTRTPAVEVISVPNDITPLCQLQATWRRIWRAMRAGIVYPNPSAFHCGGCPYRSACRAWPD